jgi:hypothetical protein
MRTKDQYEVTRRLYTAHGDLDYMLDVFGDTLAQKEGYKQVSGMEAIHVYLVRTHHWLPRDVRSMSAEDIRLALHVEMQGWTAPPEAR